MSRDTLHLYRPIKHREYSATSRQRHCGTCANRLLEGEVECPDGVDPGWKARGYVLACVTRASGDVRLDEESRDPGRGRRRGPSPITSPSPVRTAIHCDGGI